MTIEARDIVHSFGAGGRSDVGGRLGGARSRHAVEALRGVDATFARGRVTAILGPNGAGKTTLLRCLIGAIRPQRGTVHLDGRALSALDAATRAESLGYVAQRPIFSAGLLVHEVVELGRFALRPSPARVEAAMAANDLRADAERIVTELSVGQQQRVALARAMAQVAPTGWLVLDEPLAGLDPAHVRRVVRLLRQHAGNGGGVVATVHDVPSAIAFADDALLLCAGSVEAFGPALDVLDPTTLERVFDAPFVRYGATMVAPRLVPADDDRA